jgi:lipoyl-dependent peroxiredoxin
MKTLYTAMATAQAGREGRVRSSDGNVDVQLSLPKGLGGPETPGTTNPEQLFAAGYAACFHSALKLVAGQAGVDAGHSTVTAVVGIGANDAGGFELAVELEVNLPGTDHATAEDLTYKAHAVCPYSNATRGNIPVELTVSEDD